MRNAREEHLSSLLQLILVNRTGCMLFRINLYPSFRIGLDSLLTALLRDIPEQFYFRDKRFDIFLGDTEEFIVASLDICFLQQIKKAFFFFRIPGKGLG